MRQQIGMAVPPAGATIIFEAVLKSYARVNYDSVPSKWNINELLNQEKLELVSI